MRKRMLTTILLLIMAFTIMGCGEKTPKTDFVIDDSSVVYEEDKTGNKEEDKDGSSKEEETPIGNDYSDITISSVGDILIHSGVYKSAYNSSKGEYDFTSQFKHVKPILEEADIAVANLETTLSGAETGYSGYPTFNCPDSIVDALKYSGIDVIAGSNNHRLDKGEKGFFRTLQVVRDKGLDIIGMKKSKEEKSYVIKEVKGVKVALINYGYETPLGDGRRSLNGIPIPGALEELMDVVDYGKIEEGFKRIKASVEEARNAGAQVTALFMHWGNEYERQPNGKQKEMAKKLSDLGVDLVFGAHPHVLQPAEYITSGEKDTLIFYSLGNFISAQRKESINNVYSEQGMIASATIRCYKDGKKEILYGSYVPTWVNYKKSPSLAYEIIPVEEALISREGFLGLTDGDMERINYCKDSVDTLMTTMDTQAVFKKE